VYDNLLEKCKEGVIFGGINGSFYNNTIRENLGEGLIATGKNNQIVHNVISKNKGNGIFGYRLFDSKIENNLIQENMGCGINLNSYNVTISRNNISFNSDYGIYAQYVDRRFWDSHNITENYLYSNNYGIFLNNTQNVKVWKNNIYGNTQFQVKDYYNISIFQDGYTPNQWYKDQTGNYYGDYQTRYPSAKNDGRVWDTPYEISGGMNRLDFYPLVEKFVPPTPPNPPILILSNTTSTVGRININWTAVDGATSYSLYRSLSPITTITGLVPLRTGLTNTSYVDIVQSNGTYYYVIIAVNAQGESGCSNCVAIVVTLAGGSTDSPSDSVPNPLNNPWFQENGLYLGLAGGAALAIIGGIVFYRKKNTIIF
jgi:hypothetical protein